MIRQLTTDEHVTECVAALELALVDAKAGKLSAVVIFGDVRGENQLKTYKSAVGDRVVLIGKLMSGIFDLCCEFKAPS